MGETKVTSAMTCINNYHYFLLSTHHAPGICSLTYLTNIYIWNVCFMTVSHELNIQKRTRYTCSLYSWGLQNSALQVLQPEPDECKEQYSEG